MDRERDIDRERKRVADIEALGNNLLPYPYIFNYKFI